MKRASVCIEFTLVFSSSMPMFMDTLSHWSTHSRFNEGNQLFLAENYAPEPSKCPSGQGSQEPLNDLRGSMGYFVWKGPLTYGRLYFVYSISICKNIGVASLEQVGFITMLSTFCRNGTTSQVCFSPAFINLA